MPPPATGATTPIRFQSADLVTWRETFVFLFELLADQSRGLREKLRRKLLSDAWEKGEPFGPEERSRTLLLARLAGEAYSGLQDHAEGAIHACCRWEIDAQLRHHDDTWLHEAAVLHALFVSAGDRAVKLLSDLVQEASSHRLRALTLDGMAVSDLDPLAGLHGLRGLYLRGTKVPLRQVEELRKALPKCSISEP